MMRPLYYLHKVNYLQKPMLPWPMNIPPSGCNRILDHVLPAVYRLSNPVDAIICDVVIVVLVFVGHVCSYEQDVKLINVPMEDKMLYQY